MTPEELVEFAARRDPVVFAEKSLRNEKMERLDFDTHKFQEAIMRDTSPEMCIMKPSQTGLTTVAISKILFICRMKDSRDWLENFGIKHNGGITAIYTFPTAGDVDDFSATRFKPMIENSDEVMALMGGKKNLDAVGRKKIGISHVLFRGTHTERQAISIPADLIVNDELDFSSPMVVGALQSRLRHSKFKWWWKFSTPTIPNYGIDAEFNKSDQQHWMVKCPRCNQRQQIKWPRNVKNIRRDGRRIQIWGCKKCGKELDQGAGVWVAKRPTVDYRGYSVSPAICSWISPMDIAKERLNYHTEKEFRNYTLGEAYTTGEDVITRDLMLERIGFGDGYNEAIDTQTFMGVDQGDILHYTISRRRGGQRETIKVGHVNTFEQIGGLMRMYNIDLCVMDALPNKKPAEKLARDFFGRVKLAIYKEYDDTDVVRESKTMEHGILLDRTNILDMTASSWNEGESRVVLDHHMFRSIPDFIDDPDTKTAFIQQMGNMTRDLQENKKSGKSRAVWIKTGPDHYRHADGYNFIAFLQRQGGDISDLMFKENQALVGDTYELDRTFPGSSSTFDTQF